MKFTGYGRRIGAALIGAACATLVCAALAGCGGKKQAGFAGSGYARGDRGHGRGADGRPDSPVVEGRGGRGRGGDTLALIDVEKLMLQRRQLLASVEEIRANRRPVAETVRQAADNLENIEKSYRRINALFEQGTATQQQRDDAYTKYQVAQSQLESAKAQGATLDAREATVRASIALLDRQIRDGAVIAPPRGDRHREVRRVRGGRGAGSAVFKIADTRRFWIKVYVSERDLGLFSVGSATEVRVDAHAEPLAGIVSWVSPEAEFTPKNVETKEARAELVYAVKVSIENPPGALKIGMPAEVHLK